MKKLSFFAVIILALFAFGQAEAQRPSSGIPPHKLISPFHLDATGTPESGYVLQYNSTTGEWTSTPVTGVFDPASPGAIGGTTPAAGTFSPLKAKGPAAATTFATTASRATTNLSFPNNANGLADAILCGYHASNPVLGTTIVLSANTMVILSWTNAYTAVVDVSGTIGSAAITSATPPITFMVDNASPAVLKWAVLANGSLLANDKTIISLSASTSLTASQIRSQSVYVTGAYTVTLPAAVVGMNACIFSIDATAKSVDVDGSDHWVLNGTALTAGNKVTSASLAGDTLCFECGVANTWFIRPGLNVNWTDGGG